MKRRVRDLEDEYSELETERDQLAQEITQYEVDSEKWIKADGDKRLAIEHARRLLIALPSPDAFSETMSQRAIEVLSDLLGDVC